MMYQYRYGGGSTFASLVQDLTPRFNTIQLLNDVKFFF